MLLLAENWTKSFPHSDKAGIRYQQDLNAYWALVQDHVDRGGTCGGLSAEWWIHRESLSGTMPFSYWWRARELGKMENVMGGKQKRYIHSGKKKATDGTK